MFRLPFVRFANLQIPPISGMEVESVVKLKDARSLQWADLIFVQVTVVASVVK